MDLSANNYITDYELYLGNPNDSTLLEAAITSHAKTYGKSFLGMGADKGFYDKNNI